MNSSMNTTERGVGSGTGNLRTLSRTLGSYDPDENFSMSCKNQHQ